MPELPEVETIVRDLNKNLKNKKIKKVTADHAKTVAPLSIPTFTKRLKGQVIEDVKRRAKVIIITLAGGDFLLTHLKMTGQLIYQPATGALVVGGHPQPNGGVDLPNKFTRIVMGFEDGSTLYFNDMRKFGWMRLMSKSDMEKYLQDYGVEPLSKEFTTKKLKEIFTRFPNRTIKQSLFDQTKIAGLGNIYIDEACFLSNLKPDRKVTTLKDKDIEKLKKSIVDVLKLSIKKRGTSARNYVTADGTKGGFVTHLNVYSRAGEDCKVCSIKISKIKHAGRGTHFCTNCQK